MTKEILQVRDVPKADVDVLRARATVRRMSLASYLRELIHDDACRPTMAEVVERIATRDSIDADSEDIRVLLETGRQ